MTDNGARALADDVRRVITDAYYETRNEGLTMETAADRARDAVMSLLPDAAELDRLRRIEAAARAFDRALVAKGYDGAAREVFDLRAALQPEGSARDGG